MERRAPFPWPAIVALAVLGVAGGCGDDNDGREAFADVAATMTLTSEAFESGGTIPREFTCDGRDISPQLRWSGAPEGTKALVLIMDDPDAGSFDHWVLYDVPAATTELDQGASPGGRLPAGATEGRNGFKKTGYGGPCPPRGKPHHYSFRVYALDAPLSLDAGARKRDVERAMQHHVLSWGELVGLYQRT